MNDENQIQEFKVSWRDEYLKWICGFANAQGGKLFIGVDDRGEVRGVPDAHRLLEELPNKIVALLGIVPDVNVLSEDGREYIEIDVAPSNVPISLKGVYHYRSGSTKQELGGIALQQFILKKLGRTWDDIICEQARIEHIDRNAVDYFLRKAVAAQRLPADSLGESTETVLGNLGLVDADGKLKNAAVLLFGLQPQRFIPAAHFKIGFFGRDGADLIFQDLVEGNILKMCDTVVETLKAKYLISPIHYEGLQRVEPLEIPEGALREAIFNSIVHKDYMGQAIQMKVWRDRIELWNSGRLPDDLPPEKLLQEHASETRNKTSLSPSTRRDSSRHGGAAFPKSSPNSKRRVFRRRSSRNIAAVSGLRSTGIPPSWTRRSPGTNRGTGGIAGPRRKLWRKPWRKPWRKYCPR